MADLFLSYSSDEKFRAALVAQRLEEHGWSVWWDQHIAVGSDWAKSIKAELDEARGVVVLWSALSVASDWVTKEARFAERKGILIPALIDDVEVPFEFESYQAARLVGWDGGASEDFDRFVEGIEARVPRSKGTAQAAGDRTGAGPVPLDAPVHGVTTAQRDYAVVLAAYRSFCAFLTGVLRELSVRPWTSSDPDETHEDEARAKARAERIQASVLDKLARLEGDVRRSVGAAGLAAFADAKYAMVALTDELVVAQDWEGRSAWGRNRLEAQVFQTDEASEDVFRRIRALLDAPPHEGGHMEYLYLSVLALGFRGKYRDEADHGTLRRLRLRLLHAGVGGDVSLSNQDEPLFPQTRGYTLTTTESLIPAVRPWTALLVAAVAVYLVVSHIAWVAATAGLFDGGAPR